MYIYRFLSTVRFQQGRAERVFSTVVVLDHVRYYPSTFFSMNPTKVYKNTELSHHERAHKCSWQTLAKVYNEFASQSTIHGTKYTTEAKTTVGRCLWLLIVSLSLVASCQLANKFYERHQSGNMRTLVISSQYPSWRLTLPAITLCHSNIATIHRLEFSRDSEKTLRMPIGVTFEDFQDSLKYLAIILRPSSGFEKELQILDRVLAENHMSVYELFQLTSPKCSDFLMICQLEGKIKDCDNLIISSLTPLGICCSFNYAHIGQEHRWNTSGKDYHSVHFGARFILSFLVKSHGSDDRISSMMYGDGIKVLIHDRYSYPGPMTLEFVAATGHETVARLYGRHLKSSPEVLTLEPEARDCYKSDSSAPIYTSDNCYVKCREKVLHKLCGCLPFYSSRIKEGQKICNVSHTSCLASATQKAYSLTLKGPPCNCLPECEDTGFSLVTTTLPFNAAQFNPSQFYKKARELPNATAIHITYSGHSSVLQRRELVLSWINLVSSLGGVFSLFLGCSFISVIEIIYFIFVYCSWKLKGRAKQRTFGSA